MQTSYIATKLEHDLSNESLVQEKHFLDVFWGGRVGVGWKFENIDKN